MTLKSKLLSGAGNTFHVLYNSEIQPSADLARKICLQEKADGVVFLKVLDVEENFYAWDFYNNDGSHAEMCGNATRCVGYYIEVVLKRPADQIKLQTTAGSVDIRALQNHQYKVRMTKTVLQRNPKYFFCNTGVPHVVIEIPLNDDFNRHKEECRKIRKDLNTNVTLLIRTGEATAQAVSFERGVEDFTEACGTGAVAAAHFMKEKYQQNETAVEMPGGILHIDVTDMDHPIMIGPVKELGTYEFKI